jgi:hypothetical protein
VATPGAILVAAGLGQSRRAVPTIPPGMPIGGDTGWFDD